MNSIEEMIMNILEFLKKEIEGNFEVYSEIQLPFYGS